MRRGTWLKICFTFFFFFFYTLFWIVSHVVISWIILFIVPIHSFFDIKRKICGHIKTPFRIDTKLEERKYCLINDTGIYSRSLDNEWNCFQWYSFEQRYFTNIYSLFCRDSFFFFYCSAPLALTDIKRIITGYAFLRESPPTLFYTFVFLSGGHLSE